jgi:hypothetical protein
VSSYQSKTPRLFVGHTTHARDSILLPTRAKLLVYDFLQPFVQCERMALALGRLLLRRPAIAGCLGCGSGCGACSLAPCFAERGRVPPRLLPFTTLIFD